MRLNAQRSKLGSCGRTKIQPDANLKNPRPMTNKDYSALVATQREYFFSSQTRSASWRRSQLEALKALFQENHDELCDALWKDLRRHVVDADLISPSG